jgi:hypothetical protein
VQLDATAEIGEQRSCEKPQGFGNQLKTNLSTEDLMGDEIGIE